MMSWALITTWSGEANNGYWQDEIVLKTNDGRRPSIPLAVSGQAVQALQDGSIS